VLTRRIIKHLDDEAKRDGEKYKKWFADFGQFIKEGIAVDSENKDALFRLLRFVTKNRGQQDFVSIDDYISNMKEGQESIYFVVNPSFDQAIRSPYLEPFKNNNSIDVLVLTNNVDEILFQQVGEYKGKKFISIESAYEEIQKDLGNKIEHESEMRARIPEEDITGFCLWLKNELQENVSKVTISRRLKDTPALVSGQMSSSMRVMMQMMDSQGAGAGMDMNKLAKENTLELNAAHPIIVNLNQLRKTNKVVATLVAKQLLDNVMVSSGIPFNIHDGTERQYKLLS